MLFHNLFAHNFGVNAIKNTISTRKVIYVTQIISINIITFNRVDSAIVASVMRYRIYSIHAAKLSNVYLMCRERKDKIS